MCAEYDSKFRTDAGSERRGDKNISEAVAVDVGDTTGDSANKRRSSCPAPADYARTHLLGRDAKRLTGFLTEYDATHQKTRDPEQSDGSSDESRKTTMDLKLVVTLVVFTLAYCTQPLLVDWLKYQGAATPSTLLYLIPHYLAMIAVGLIPGSRSHRLTLRIWKKAAYVSIIDVAHQMAEKAGLVFAGSAVYIIVGSSSIVWTAIISAILLRNRFCWLQWLSLLTICTGLGIKASSIDFKLHDDEFIGSLLTTGSAILHGLTFVINEKFLTSKNAISGPSLVFVMGIINSTILLVWTLWWTIPRFDELVIANVEKQGGDWQVIGIILAGLFVCGFVHSCTLWYLLKRIGAVSAGVIKGLKTASVFVLSHYFFCRLQTSQCLTPLKATSAAICVLGVISYSLVTARKSLMCSDTRPRGEASPTPQTPLLREDVEDKRTETERNETETRAAKENGDKGVYGAVGS